MTFEETIGFLEVVTALFPSFQPTEQQTTIWAEFLAPFPAQSVTRALHKYVANSGSEFAPTVPQLINTMRDEIRTERTKFKSLPYQGETKEQRSEVVARMHKLYPELFEGSTRK